MLLVASKITGRKKWLDLAVSMDNLNLRALVDRAGNSRTNVGKLMIATQIVARVPSDIGDLVVENLARAEGQLLQDIFALTANGGKKKGVFVEVGVGNGRELSNTYLLEKELGWTGLLIEPNRSMHSLITASRIAQLDTAAAAAKSGMLLEFEEVKDAGEFSRLVGSRGHDITENRIERYNVTTTTLNEAFEKAGIPNKVDFMSIDTEGSEIDVISGLDLEKYRFAALAIEHNYDQPKLDAIRNLLLPQGYRQVFAQVSGFDAWFIHKTAPCQF